MKLRTYTASAAALIVGLAASGVAVSTASGDHDLAQRRTHVQVCTTSAGVVLGARRDGRCPRGSKKTRINKLGPAGPAGERGEQGLPGTAGEPGPKGDLGPRGPRATQARSGLPAPPDPWVREVPRGHRAPAQRTSGPRAAFSPATLPSSRDDIIRMTAGCDASHHADLSVRTADPAFGVQVIGTSQADGQLQPVNYRINAGGNGVAFMGQSVALHVTVTRMTDGVTRQLSIGQASDSCRFTGQVTP